MKKVKFILLIAITVLVICGLAFNVFAFINVQGAKDDVEELRRTLNGETEDVLAEDDVTIGGEYVIRSTLNISDAYKSGDTSALSDKEKETLDMASEVLSEITTDEMSDYEKELAVYDWMTSDLQYDEGSLLVIPDTSADCDNPYGVLKYHNAVCVGYATTFRLFMQMMDIECMVVHDSYLSHSWDLVKLDGDWYHTDIYFDAGTGGYANFNMNDTLCEVGHTWNTDFFPAANGIKYNHAMQNSQEVDDIYSMIDVVKTLADEGKSTDFALTFKTEPTDDDAPISEYMVGELDTMLENYYDAYFQGSWTTVDDKYVFIGQIIFSTYDDDDVVDIDDDTASEINDKIAEAFGLDSDWDDYTDDWEFDGDYILNN